MKYVDYIVVGGGISGSVLSYTLMKYGASVHMFDLPLENHSSVVASGLWNPVVFKTHEKSLEGGRNDRDTSTSVSSDGKMDR